MSRLPIVLSALAIVFFLGCEEFPTETESETALFKKGGKPGGGGGGPADPEIAFIRGPGTDLWVMDGDGGNAALLVRDDEIEQLTGYHNVRHPSWSPLGCGTVEDPFRIAVSVGNGGLVTVDAWVDAGGGIQTRDLRVLSDHAADGDPSYSPDGQLIAIRGYSDTSTCGGGGSLYVMAADGSGAPEEVYCSQASFGVSSPTWSPDGGAIAFGEHFDDDDLAVIGEDGIRICNLVTSGDGSLTCDTPLETAVSRYEADHLEQPDWSNDGSTLLFTRWTSSIQESGVYRVAVAHDGLRWTRQDGVDIESMSPIWMDPSWSPDDSHIAAHGIEIYDATTLRKKKAPKGHAPDWRGPSVSACP